MEIRKTTMDELEAVLELYEEARQFMRESGNPDQWGTTNPPKERVEADIVEGKSYVCEEDGQLLGTFFFSEGPDPTYQVIYDGAWKNDAPYHVVHRVACPGRKKGVGSVCIQWCIRQSCGNVRIDTHEQNLPMQHMLEKNGFVRCGIIHLTNGAERIAYQKTP